MGNIGASVKNDSLVDRIKETIRSLSGFNLPEIRESMGFGMTDQDEREFSIAFGRARRLLKKEFIFFKAPTRKDKMYRRLEGEAGFVTAGRQSDAFQRKGMKALDNGKETALLAAQSGMTDDPRKTQAMLRKHDRLAMKISSTKMFSRKRNIVSSGSPDGFR